MASKKNRTLNWPTDYDNMVKPYGRWPFAVIDEQGLLFTRCKTKGFFEHVYYDHRPNGGYHSISMHITHKKLMFGKYIWDKKELSNIIHNKNK